MFGGLLSKLQFYGILVLGAFLAALGLRAKWVADGVRKQQAKQAQERLNKIDEANGVRNEVEAMDPDTLERRASVWVRRKHDQ